MKLLKRDSRCKFYLMTKPHQTQNYSSSDSLLQLSHPNTKGHHSHPPHTPHFVLTLRSFFARQERWRGDTQGWPRRIAATALQHLSAATNLSPHPPLRPLPHSLSSLPSAKSNTEELLLSDRITASNRACSRAYASMLCGSSRGAP